MSERTLPSTVNLDWSTVNWVKQQRYTLTGQNNWIADDKGGQLYTVSIPGKRSQTNLNRNLSLACLQTHWYILLKIGQQAMALSFPNQKHSVYISVSCASNMMIQFYIYMDHLFQLLRNLNSLAFYLIENSVLYPILNISKESFKSAFPYFLGCRPNYTSQAVSVSSPVKIRLFMYYIWLCTKIIYSNAWSYT